MKKPIDDFLIGSDDDDILDLINIDQEADKEEFISDIPKRPKDNSQPLSLNEKEFEPKKHKKSSTHSSHSHHDSHSSHSHSSSHSSRRSKSKKSKMSTAGKLAIAILALLLALILTVVGTLSGLELKGKNDLIHVTKQENFEETIEYQGHKYVYNENVVAFAFMGVDKRELGTVNGQIGTAGQADADIVVAVDVTTGKITAIAVPRDTMVEVDLYSASGVPLGAEKMQLCLSYAYGDGKETSAQNVMTSLSRILLNVPIEKYFALDLDGIAPINDAIGGVDVTSLYDLNNYGIKKGDKIHLSGDLTEAYVRTRNMDNIEASLNRTARQVQYIKAFAAQLLPAVTSDFSTVSKLYYTAQDYSSTNISLSNATYFASLILSKGVEDFEAITLEGEMKASDKLDKGNFVYAEFYPDENSLYDTVLGTFYNKID